jgi:CBS-domain-containing membrane protein
MPAEGKVAGEFRRQGDRPMQARDIMTRSVITVGPETPLREIVSIMLDRHISGLPVVAHDGRIIGIVSQSDLLHRAELGTERKHKWWFRTFGDSNTLAKEFAKAHGLKAHDVMSRHVVSVREDSELGDVADILDNRRIKRVPVVQNGLLVGLITRGDLVRALSLVQVSTPTGKIENAPLHRMLRDRIRAQRWLNKNYINLTVDDGVVELWGFVESEDERNALRALVEETSGVTRVEDNVMVGSPIRVGA